MRGDLPARGGKLWSGARVLRRTCVHLAVAFGLVLSGCSHSSEGAHADGGSDAERTDAAVADASTSPEMTAPDAGELAGCKIGAPRCDTLPGERSCVAGSSWVTCGTETTCRITYLAAGTRCGPGALCNSQHECVADK